MKRGRILYVDREGKDRILFEQLFARTLRVEVAATGDEALEKLHAGDVAVLVADQRTLGDSTNAGLLQKVRTEYPDVVRIVITAYAELNACLQSVTDGLVARYVVKPWERSELEEILRWAIEAHSRGDEDPAIQLRLVQAERLITLGSMAAALMHDLAQPVGVAETNVSRLAELGRAVPALWVLIAQHSDDLSEGDAQAVRELADELVDITSDMKAGLGHVQSLLGQMRELARAPASGDLRRAEPAAVLHFILGACRSIAARASAKLVMDCPEELPLVALTKTELTQVLMNLVSNGIQAVEKKGGGTIKVTGRIQTNALLLVVDDDGVGIPAVLMQKVGTPFFSTRPEGTGLGVAQCRRIVEGAGGTFRVESQEGVGTQVFIRLPWATVNAAGGTAGPRGGRW
jgi:two-component system response regulator PhcR